MDTRASHTRTHAQTHHNNTSTTPHGDRDRDRERQRETDKEDREKDRQRERRREKREDSISVWWCMAVFCWCSDFLVNSVNDRVFSLLNRVKYDCSFISFSASRPVNSF